MRYSAPKDIIDWSRDGKRASVGAVAPEKPGDWKAVRVESVRAGGAWWALDVNDGLQEGRVPAAPEEGAALPVK